MGSGPKLFGLVRVHCITETFTLLFCYLSSYMLLQYAGHYYILMLIYCHTSSTIILSLVLLFFPQLVVKNNPPAKLVLGVPVEYCGVV